jgi:DNA-binding NarL/FixJ family response regulator
MGSSSEGAQAEKIGILLVIDDFPMLRAGFRSAIDAQPDMTVVDELDEHDSLVDHLDRTDFDIVIAECHPLNSGGRMSVETIETIRAAKPGAKILALECGTSDEQFSLVLKAGADGFLTREAAAADVITAIHCVERGQTYVSPAIVTKMVSAFVLRSSPGALEDPYDSLSDREKEVLLLAASGHTNREIARIFHLSEQTIHNYRAGVMEKLGLHDRVELLKFAIRRGVIDVADL